MAIVEIQVIKTYRLDVQPWDGRTPLDAAYGLSSTQIEEVGSLQDVTTDCAEVLAEDDDNWG